MLFYLFLCFFAFTFIVICWLLVIYHTMVISAKRKVSHQLKTLVYVKDCSWCGTYFLGVNDFYFEHDLELACFDF